MITCHMQPVQLITLPSWAEAIVAPARDLVRLKHHLMTSGGGDFPQSRQGAQIRQ